MTKTTAPPRSRTARASSQKRRRWRGSRDESRLVEEQDVRIGEQRDRKVEALLVAERKLGAEAAVVGQLDDPEEARGRTGGIGDALQAGEELEILARGQPAVLGRTLGNPADARPRLAEHDGPRNRVRARPRG